MDRKRGYYKGLFLIAAIYDIVLGIIFTFFYKFVYSFLGIALPNDPSYLSLIGAFLFVIGVGYLLIYIGIINGKFNRDLIKVGTLYKFAYSAVAFYYWILGTIPHIAFGAVFGVVDLVFAFLFIECLNYTKK